MYVNFWTRSNSDCLLGNKFSAKSFHSCTNSAASFLLRGIRLRRSGCYRSSQNNVFSGDSSVRRGGKNVWRRRRRRRIHWSVFEVVENSRAGCIIPMQNVDTDVFFSIPFSCQGSTFYERLRGRHFGWLEPRANDAPKNIAEKDSRHRDNNNITHKNPFIVQSSY